MKSPDAVEFGFFLVCAALVFGGQIYACKPPSAKDVANALDTTEETCRDFLEARRGADAGTD